MKIIQRTRIIITSIGLLCLGLWLIVKATSEQQSRDLIQGLSKPTSTLPIASSLPQELKPGPTPSIDPVNGESQRRVEEIFNAPINFYGKVVNEQGKPVVGAKTFYIVTTASFSGSPTMNGPDTDQDGQFSITGKSGPTLSVWVKHPDYHQTASADQIFKYSSNDNYMPGKEPPAPPMLDKPALFVLQKKGIAEPLVHLKSIELSPSPKGVPVTLNIRNGRLGSGNETITFSLNSEADKQATKYHRFNWNVVIQIPEGGLIESSNKLDFQAPVDGYRSQETIKMPSSLGEKWMSDIQRNYFVKFSSGNYGRIRMEISGQKGWIIVESFLNPTAGSRNLEFDPAKDLFAP